MAGPSPFITNGGFGVNTGNSTITVIYANGFINTQQIGEVANANYAAFSNVADSANSVVGANVSGEVANANYAAFSNVADSANSVAGSNVSGEVANANYASFSGVAASANTVDGANVAGIVANANYASFSNIANNVTGTVANANYALFSNVSNTSNSVAGANVVGVVSDANYAAFSGVAASANTVAGSNVTGVVANANYAAFSGVAASANTVAGSNVTGVVANANYAAYAGNVTIASQPNITSVGTLTGLTVNGDATVTGNLNVSGNLTYIDVTNLRIQDPVIQLGGGPNGAPLTSDDGKDRGTYLHKFDTGANAEIDKFMGWDSSAGEFAFGSNVTLANDVVTFNALGNVRADTFIGTLEGTAANATVAFSVDGSNVSGVVANANYAAFSGVAASANSVSGANVSGDVSGANHANISDAANVAYSVDAANVVGTVANANYAAWSGVASSANSVTGANVSGDVSGANHANIADVANSVSGANVSGEVANANYAAYAGNVTIAAQANITSLGTLTGLTVNGVSNLGAVANVKITGGSNTQVLTTDGAGNLSWAVAGLNYKYTKEWHVDPVNGNDTTGDGSYNKPYLTVAKALTSTGPAYAAAVYLHASAYSENVTIVSPVENVEIIGVNDTGTTQCSGNWAFSHTGTSIRVRNVRFSGTVTQTSTGPVYFDDCTLSSFAKSGTAYTQFDMSDVTTASFTSNALTLFRGGSISSLTLNNAGARVYVYNMTTVATTTVTAGIYFAFDSTLYSSSATTNAITSSTGTTVGVYRSQITNSSGTLSRVSLAGNWTINDSTYDKANSTLTGTNLGTVSHFDAITIHNGLTVTGNILPSANVTYNLGSPTQRWNTLYLSNNTLYLGDVALSTDANGALTVNNNVVATYSNGVINGTASAANVAYSVSGSNVSGTVANANYAAFAGVVTTASQPNITNIGTNAVANGTNSLAFGHTSRATAGNAIAIGANSRANAVGAVVIGPNAVSNVANTIVLGAATHDTVVSNVLTVLNSTFLEKDLNVQESITCASIINGDSLSINQTANIGTDLTVTGNTYLNTNADVLGDLNVSGNISANNISATLDITVGGNATVNGNLNVNGNLTYIDVTNLRVQDPVIQLGGGPNGVPLTSNDGRDRGTYLHVYDTGANAEVDKFMGWDNSNSEFAFGSNVTIANDVVTFNSLGNVRAAYFIGNGSALDAVTGANVTGVVANANYAAFAGTSLEVANGTSSVSIPVASGNIEMRVGGTMVIDSNAVQTSFLANTVSVQYDLNAGNRVYANSFEAAGNITATSIEAYGSLTTAFLTATLTASFNEDASVGANLSVGNTLDVTGAANIGGMLTVSADSDLAGNVIVGEELYVNNNMTVINLIQSNTLSVGTDANVGANLSVGGGINVTGDGYIGGNLEVSGDLIIGGLSTTGDITAGLNLNAGDSVVVNNAVRIANVSTTVAGSLTTTSTSTVELLSLDASVVQYAKIIIKASSTGGVSSEELTLICDGSNVAYSSINMLSLGTTGIVEAPSIVGGMISVQVTPATIDSTDWKFTYTTL